MVDVDRVALAEFLRRRRESLRPDEVGLHPGARRRTPGLRREEVGQLAGMSADYYGRLEQARGPQPSPQIIRALARALRLTGDETDHLYRLAGHAVPDRVGRRNHVRPALLFLLDHLRDAAAFVCSDTGAVLAQNSLARLLHGDLVTDGRGVQASMTWRWFTEHEGRARVPADEQSEHSRVLVADLRAAWGRRRDDADMRELVTSLIAASSEFAELWSLHEVALKPVRRKTFHTPVGPITLDCEVLSDLDGQQLVVLTPPPASSAGEALQLLATIGEQPIGVD
ncbi:helix-turn-helix transcriptional regulator [Mycobacterium sp. GA-2829]|uniref:helix-turn-helix transcriptional regulator n=1 Tax=Mycobacterium sp. GA-2829 TaxID=1772283 RepID=UPI0007404D93|nr:helix-turn-helix transcriptional regulator [Mycobacterium sp. GA-2829]KUI22391.1 XRE family transcriptional regulator [Mycobacterium sp. GA-2829]